MKRPLTDKDLMDLRQKSFIAADETAYWMGDKLIAEHLITHQCGKCGFTRRKKIEREDNFGEAVKISADKSK